MVYFAKVRPSFHFIEDSVPTKRSSDHKAKKMFSLAKKIFAAKNSRWGQGRVSGKGRVVPKSVSSGDGREKSKFCRRIETISFVSAKKTGQTFVLTNGAPSAVNGITGPG